MLRGQQTVAVEAGQQDAVQICSGTGDPAIPVPEASSHMFELLGLCWH